MSPRRRSERGGRRVALLSKRGRFVVAEPFFDTGPEVALGGARGAEPGRLAVVEATAGRARLVAPLGRPDVAGDVVEALLCERGVRRGFPASVEREAQEQAARVAADPGPRRDLRELPTFTVDPRTARDFDDAVSVRREGDGLRLWIHIADVSAHVRPASLLDRVAHERGNSTYVPGSVEPMLPHALSSEACSLQPGALRQAVTVEVELDPEGRPASTSFYRSTIRSDARLDYDQLDGVFAGREQAPEPVSEPLALARRAAGALATARRGAALEVSGAEPEFDFDSGGNVVAARMVEQTEAHRLIEHLMILANERVAEVVERAKVPTLYRVHEQPDPDRVALMLDQLASLDVPTPPLPEQPGPSEAGRVAAEASRLVAAEARRRGHGAEAFGVLVLRSLKQASYSDANLGHAGLASPAYCHFTSPIRRYPDLVVHRGLLSAVGEGEEPPRRDEAREAGWHCSERERQAMTVEREADKVCACFLLERELFERGSEERFEGEVVGLVGAGAFVRFGGDLAGAYEGFLPARSLRGERFRLNEAETALVGGRTGRAVRLGDPVTVGVERIEAPRGRVDLYPADEGPPPRRGGRGPRGRR